MLMIMMYRNNKEISVALEKIRSEQESMKRYQ